LLQETQIPFFVAQYANQIQVEKLEKEFKERIQANFQWTKNLATTCYLIYLFEIEAKQTDVAKFFGQLCYWK